jgi:hypothetical protein
MEKEISQLVHRGTVVAGFERVGDLVRFFDQVG